MLVDAEDVRVLVEEVLEQSESWFPQVAEPGVVVAALGVVPVRDDGRVDADGGEDVEGLVLV